MSLEEVQFFGAVDRKDRRADGRICSEYPAFYFSTHLDELEESIASKERALERGEIYPTEIPNIKAELKREKDRLGEIDAANIELKGKAKDEAAAFYKDLGGQIQDSLFTRTAMKKGLANPHDEAKRMKGKGFINVRGKTKILENMGINAHRGKVNRTQAARAYKILGKMLGEETNIEHLRKDHNFGTYHPDVPLDEMLR